VSEREIVTECESPIGVCVNVSLAESKMFIGIVPQGVSSKTKAKLSSREGILMAGEHATKLMIISKAEIIFFAFIYTLSCKELPNGLRYRLAGGFR
jgi:hypothetical protein